MTSTRTRSGGLPLRRSQAVLRQLAGNREGCSFSHLRTIESGLTAASLSRLLKAMQAENMVAKDERTGAYRLHPDFIRFALMAFLPEPEVCDRLQRHGPPPIAEPDYRRRLEEIRQGRVIIDDLIRPGGYPATRVARPVFRGDGGELVGILLVSINAASLPMTDQERLTAAVTSAAARATEMLKRE